MSAKNESITGAGVDPIAGHLRDFFGFNGPSWTYSHVFGPTQWNVAGVSVPVAHIAESRLPPIDQLNFSVDRVGHGMLQIRLERLDPDEGTITVLGSTAIPVAALLRVAEQDAATPGEREDLHSNMCQTHRGDWPPTK